MLIQSEFRNDFPDSQTIEQSGNCELLRIPLSRGGGWRGYASAAAQVEYFDNRKIVCSSSGATRSERMRIKSIVTSFVALLVAQSAYAKDDQPCIARAAEALPRIGGLVVKKSRTRPVSAAILATWKGQTRPIIVDVDFIADGGAQMYSYLCVVTRGSAFVQRTMN
jgi:hypothetical protein